MPTATRMRVIRSPSGPGLVQFLHPGRFVMHLWRQRELISQFTRREIEGRYRSSFLGVAWSFITPLALLAVYTFVFGVVLKQRWTGAPSGRLSEFGLILFAGLIAFNVFSECVGRAASLVVSTPNYVKRVVFPLELLPLSILGSALFHAAVSVAILCVADLSLGARPQWSWLLVPVVILPAAWLSLGCVWFLASLGVFIRDLGYAVAIVLQVLFFVTPVFYPVDVIPMPYRTLMEYNPLASVVQTMRAVIFPGVSSVWPAFGVSAGFGLIVMISGYAWFMRTRRAFGDVI